MSQSSQTHVIAVTQLISVVSVPSVGSQSSQIDQKYRVFVRERPGSDSLQIGFRQGVPPGRSRDIPLVIHIDTGVPHTWLTPPQDRSRATSPRRHQRRQLLRRG